MVEPSWPLSSHHEELLRDLARVLALGGTRRFARGPVVAASEQDYPERWNQTRDALGTVIARTLWHAHLDYDIVLHDVRAPGEQRERRLRGTRLELVHADTARIELEVSSIGNDDVAGIVAHEIGRAYVTQLTRRGQPFRDGGDGNDATELAPRSTGTIATVALGLGVVALNAAHHDRSAGDVVGNTAYHEHQIATAGGLDWQDLAFLVAVQATVRDDVLSALDTLRRSQSDCVAAWIDVLDDHEDELAQALALGDPDTEPPLARPTSPRTADVRASFNEGDLNKPYLGQRVFRWMSGTKAPFHAVLGLGVGLAGAIVMMLILGPRTINAIPLPVFIIAGFLDGRRVKLYKCASCRSFVTKTDTQCRGCGGSIVGDIKHPDDRLDAEEELDRKARTG